MTTQEFVEAVYLVAAGKIPTFAAGSTKWNKIVAIGNNKIDVWQSEDGWKTLYQAAFSLGTVTATDTFDLDDDIRRLSDTYGDTIRIVRTDGAYTDYETVPADRLKEYTYGNYCAQVGRTIVFSRTFTSQSPEFGGTLFVPVYLYAEHMVSAVDDVPVDDPQWLVLVTSAEYVRNDIVKQNQYPNLINEANSLMVRMKETNGAQLQETNAPWRPLGTNW